MHIQIKSKTPQKNIVVVLNNLEDIFWAIV